MGVIKLNSDVTIQNGVTEVSVVGRDHFGNVPGVFVFKANIDLPTIAKTFAVLQTDRVASEGGCSKVCFESDTKVVNQNLNDSNNLLAHWFSLGFVEAIRSRCLFFCLDSKNL